MNILFIGMYPDEYNKYRNVFFQNLIYAMADEGVKCTVISPVPITKYRKSILKVSKKRFDYTPKGNIVRVIHPRYISLSNIKIGPLNTGYISEKLFQIAAYKCSKTITDNFDAVYGHFLLAGGLSAIQVGNLKKIPSFFAYGECDYSTEIEQIYGNVKSKEITGLSGIISVSTSNANLLKSKSIFNDIPILVAPNAVDMSLFKPMSKTECRRELGLPLDKFIVGFVGGFIDRKGDKRLLEAVNGTDEIFCAFAGKGDNPPFGDKVIFCKSLDHSNIPIFLNAIDVFCLPTLNEGSCNAIVEAAACGVPVISSDLPFNDDLLNNNNSLRIDPNSIKEIRCAIEELYGNTALRNAIGTKIKEDSNRFSIENRCKNILGFIENQRRRFLDEED